MIPAFNACTESPEPGIRTSRTVSAIPITSTSLCPAPTVSSSDELLAGGVEQERSLQRRLGEAAEMAARPHRADEDARVEEVVGEPDPVAQERALGERARRIDRDDADGLLRLAHVPDDRADQRRLADPGRAGDADDVGGARLRVELADELVRERVAVLDEADRTRERPPVAAPDPAGELLERPGLARGQTPGSPRAASERARRASSPATRYAAAAPPHTQRAPNASVSAPAATIPTPSSA